MPFIISISGAEKIGVSVACQRLYHALRHTHTVKIVDMKTRNNVMAFEDDLLTDEYKDFDVLIIDKHPSRTLGCRRRACYHEYCQQNAYPPLHSHCLCLLAPQKDTF